MMSWIVYSIIVEEKAKKSSEDEKVSVTRVLDPMDIAPEARLRYAFLVKDIIDFGVENILLDTTTFPKPRSVLDSRPSSFAGMKRYCQREIFQF